MSPLTQTTVRALRRPLILAAAMVALSVGILAGVAWLLADAQLSLEKARRGASAAEQQVRNVQEENRALERSLSQYQSLRQRRVVGNTQRLDWTEQLLIAGQPLLDFEYRFAPTTNPAAPNAADGTPPLYQALVTTSELKATLRHEVELLTLLDRLEHGGPLVRTRSCRLEQEPAPEARGVIRAECQLDWITIAPVTPGTEGQAR